MEKSRRSFLKTSVAGLTLPALLGAQLNRPADSPETLTMEITRNHTLRSMPGPDAWFTGSVRIDPLFNAKDPARAGAASVTFEPGARTAWHTHPLGQRLIIIFGTGWVQCEGGPIETVNPGDVVWFPPEVKHWHGASPDKAMTHIAIQEANEDGKVVEWMEHVSDAQYQQ